MGRGEAKDGWAEFANCGLDVRREVGLGDMLEAVVGASDGVDGCGVGGLQVGVDVADGPAPGSKWKRMVRPRRKVMLPTWMVFVHCVFLRGVWEYSQLWRAKKTAPMRRKAVARSWAELMMAAVWICLKTRDDMGSWCLVGGVVAAVKCELGADFGVDLSGLGVVEGVSGLMIVDGDLCDVSDCS